MAAPFSVSDVHRIAVGMLIRCLAVVLLTVVGSCVSVEHASVPEAIGMPRDKDASNAVSIDCPDLSGSYSINGQLAEDTPKEICDTSSPNYEWVLDWLCDARLSANLGDKHSAAPVVRIEQPDAGTMIMYSRAGGTNRVVLQRRNGDFDCDSGVLKTVEWGVERPQWGDSRTGNETGFQRNFSRFQSVFGMLILSGGHRSLRREFYKNPEGALVMKIARSSKGLSTAIPVIETYSTFVTWKPATPDEIAEAHLEIAPAPPAGGGLVFFYREPKVQEGYTTVHVSRTASSSEGEHIALSGGWSGSCVPLAVPAGHFEAWVGSQRRGASVALDVVSGAIYYVKVESKIGWSFPRVDLSVIEADKAQEGLLRSGCLK